MSRSIAAAGSSRYADRQAANVSSLVDSREYRGLWWLPGRENDQLAGTLAIDQGKVALELLGHFGQQLLSDTGRERTYGLALEEHPRIVGLTTDGKCVTLEGHQASPYTLNFPGIATATYRRDVALIGKHFASDETIGFDEIAIHASDLSAWTQVSGFRNKIGMEKHKSKDALVFTNVDIRFEAPDDVEIPLARGARAFIRFSGSSHGLRGGTDHVELCQEAALHLRFSKQLGLDEALDRVGQVRNFLSLAIGRPVAILGVTGYQDDHVREGSGALLPIEIVWELPYNPDPPAQVREPRDMLFTLSDAAPDIETVMTSWFAKQDRFAPVFNLFFGVRHHPNLTLDVRFLLYAQALETYDYRRRRSPGKKTLAGRMDDVLNRCRTVSRRVVGGGSGDQAAFIEEFKTTRNYYTHYNPKLEKKAARGAALALLFFQAQAILEMALLRELGFGCRAIDGILVRADRYTEIDHFKALVASEAE